MRKKYDVQITHDGVAGCIVVDGKDLSCGVRAAKWSAEVGCFPTLELELLAVDVTELGSKETEILIPNATAEALIALGWTPPAQAE